MYAVTGSPGKSVPGGPQFLSEDQLVRAVVRMSKGAEWADLGCDIAVADLAGCRGR